MTPARCRPGADARRRRPDRRPRARRSSSAAAPAASARRRRPRRSACAPPSAAAASSCSPSTRPAGWPSRWASPSSTTPRARSTGIDTTAGGSLHAMMLDMKRTFDEVVDAHADAEQGRADPRQPLLPGAVAAPSPARRSTWRWRSSASSRRAPAADEWDLIVVDTPPSPLGARLPRRAATARPLPRRPASSGCSPRRPRPAAAPASRCFGVGVRHGHRRDDQDPRRPDAHATCRRSSPRSTRCSAASASAPSETYRLLAERRARRSSSSPRRSADALREASYFVERLDADGMPLAGLVVNRIGRVSATGLSPSRALAAAESLEEGGGPKSATNAAGLLRLHAALVRTAERQRELARPLLTVTPRHR